MGKINNITSYPISTPVIGGDIAVGSAAGSGGNTVNFTMADISAYIVGNVPVPTLQDVCASGSSTNTTVGIADTLTLSKASGTGLAVTANATIGGILSLSKSSGTGLSVTSDVNIGGGIDCYGLHHQWGALTVEGTATLNGALDANSTADIADTLTLSKSSGTGLSVTANAIVGGRLTAAEINAQVELLFHNSGTLVGGFASFGSHFYTLYGALFTGNVTCNNKLSVIGNLESTGKLIVTGAAPATATSTGTLGQIATDANYIYVCTATNTWKRVAIATW